MALTETDKYTLAKENNVVNLLKNGELTICPKMSKLIVPNSFKQEGFKIMEFPCNSKCPFFKNAELTRPEAPDVKIKGVYLECMDKPTVRVISEDQAMTDSPKMVITK